MWFTCSPQILLSSSKISEFLNLLVTVMYRCSLSQRTWFLPEYTCYHTINITPWFFTQYFIFKIYPWWIIWSNLFILTTYTIFSFINLLGWTISKCLNSSNFMWVNQLSQLSFSNRWSYFHYFIIVSNNVMKIQSYIFLSTSAKLSLGYILKSRITRS